MAKRMPLVVRIKGCTSSFGILDFGNGKETRKMEKLVITLHGQ